MLESSTVRKNRVNLADYNCQEDIENRVLMSDFSTLDIAVLQEILFQPLKISIKKISKNFVCNDADFQRTLKTLAKTGLLVIADDTIIVDKEKRKYFEFEIARFDPDFKPDMHFLQGLLRKVPIHVLPTWYAIPRTSNNIFESIIERYLINPLVYQRYIADLNVSDPRINAIIEDLFTHPHCKLYSTDIIAKYNLKREEFEEILLLLEFNFAAYLCYEKAEDHWLEYIVPFYEWHEYLSFINATRAKHVPAKTIQRSHKSDFYFIDEMTALLSEIKKKPIPATDSPISQKLLLLKLVEVKNHKNHITEMGNEWLSLSIENKALFLYRDVHNRILSLDVPERMVREAEKSIKTVLHCEWVHFEDFFQGASIALHDQSTTLLKKCGKHWKYALPTHSVDEKAIIKATIFEWLFEMGMVTIGTCNGSDCFAVTPFGRFFFEG